MTRGESRSPIFRPQAGCLSKGVIHDLHSVPAGSFEKQTPSEVWEPLGMGAVVSVKGEERRAAVGRKRLWRKDRWAEESSTEWKWPGLTLPLPPVTSQVR